MKNMNWGYSILQQDLSVDVEPRCDFCPDHPPLVINCATSPNWHTVGYLCRKCNSVWVVELDQTVNNRGAHTPKKMRCIEVWGPEGLRGAA